MNTITETLPTEETSSYKFLNYAFRFHDFAPQGLRNRIEQKTRYPTRFQPWFHRLNERSFDSINEEDRARLSLYWKYDEALMDGGYTLERLWRCHGADVTLHDGTVLHHHPSVAHHINAERNKNNDDDDGGGGYDANAEAVFESDDIMRELYAEDINHIIRGGVLSDLAREYCFTFRSGKKVKSTIVEKNAILNNLRPKIPPLRMQKCIKDDRFHQYVNRMTGLAYAQLWPDARFLWGEFWEHDEVLLEAGYSFERLKIFHMLMFHIECCDGIFRLKPYMLANWNDDDDMAEARKAAKCHPKDWGARFVQDVENALSQPELLLLQKGSRQDLKSP